MRLKYSKDEKGNISIKFSHSDNGTEKEAEFSYVYLINILYSKKYVFDDPEFIGDFSEFEITKITEMMLKLNESVRTNI
jgi:hypothetical protein